MTERIGMIVAALLVTQGAVHAQTPGALPTKCPFDQKLWAARVQGGGVSTLAAGNGTIECKPGGCRVSVKVASYKPDFQPESCCSYIEQGLVVALKKPKPNDPSIDITWFLVPTQAGSEYVFSTVNPITLSPAPTPGDFDAPNLKKKGELTLPSFNNLYGKFNYGLTLFRANTDGTYLACDPNDPVIVNQGN